MNGKSDWMQTNALTRPVYVSAFICVLCLHDTLRLVPLSFKS